jgi:hypothetical protein
VFIHVGFTCRDSIRCIHLVVFNWVNSSGCIHLVIFTVVHYIGCLYLGAFSCLLQSILPEKLDTFLPQKTVKFSSEDQVWATPEIKDISRKKRREYLKHRKSSKWKALEEILNEKCEIANQSFYENIVQDLKNSNPGQWYSKVKRMTSYDQLKSEQVIVESICHLSDKDQVEIVADSFSKVSNQYDEINPEKICLRSANNKASPKFEAHQIYEYLKKIKTNTSTVKDDIPAKIIKEFACELSDPLADVINCMVERGEFPNIWKLEMVTPAPKVYPPPLLLMT